MVTFIKRMGLLLMYKKATLLMDYGEQNTFKMDKLRMIKFFQLIGIK